MDSPTRICLQLDMEQTFGPEVALGVRRYSVTRGRNWLLSVPDWGEPLSDRLRADGSTGIIARIANAVQEEAVVASGLPTVNVSGALRVSRLARVQSDDRRCGRAAAEHLLDRGFRSFAAPFLVGQVWRDRVAAFARAVRRAGCRCATLDLRTAEPPTEPRFIDRLAQWLGSLPSPVGVMAASDLLGRRLSDACHVGGLAVPERVAIVGIDNSELMCQLADPPLSSVDINAEQIGFVAAELLDGLMGEAASDMAEPGVSVRVPPRGVVVRPSSDTLAVSNPDVAEALRIIRQRACEPLSVEALMREIAVSRRSLENRMKSAIGRTPGQEIRRVQVERAKEFLVESSLPLEVLADRVGFATKSSFNNAFLRQVGVTPGAYRRQHGRAALRKD